MSLRLGPGLKGRRGPAAVHHGSVPGRLTSKSNFNLKQLFENSTSIIHGATSFSPQPGAGWPGWPFQVPSRSVPGSVASQWAAAPPPSWLSLPPAELPDIDQGFCRTTSRLEMVWVTRHTYREIATSTTSEP
ncbi:Fc.00g090260.m01.CDS01 [Cosmosporella sp. VM-42]